MVVVLVSPEEARQETQIATLELDMLVPNHIFRIQRL